MLINLLSTILVFAFSDLVTLPKNCLQQQGNNKCSVWNKTNEGQMFEIGKIITYLKPGAIISLQSNHVELIGGDVIVSSKETINIESAYAHFVCQNCYVQMSVEKGSLTVRLAEGVLSMTLLGKPQSVDFMVGFETKVFAINAITGRAEQEVFRPLDLKAFLTFFDTFKDKESLQKKWQSRKDFFIENAKQAAISYRQEADRQIAEEKDKREIRDRQLSIEAEERAKLRQLYRQKNFLE